MGKREHQQLPDLGIEIQEPPAGTTRGLGDPAY